MIKNLTTRPKENTLFKQLLGTNGTMNITLIVLYALGAVYGLSETDIDGIYFAVLPAVGFITEIIKRIRKPRWVGNIITYAIMALTFILPSWESVWVDLSPLIRGLIDKLSLGELWPLFIPLLNSLLAIIRSRNNPDGEEGESA